VTTDGFAAEGQVALALGAPEPGRARAPDGYSQVDIERGRATRSKLTTEQAVMDVRAAVRELAKTGLTRAEALGAAVRATHGGNA
jgi:hypothetical protein